MERKRIDLLHKNIVVYDLEIKKLAQDCKKGWKGYDEMGISVGACFDYRDARYRIFMDDNIAELVARLNEPDTLVVAFNHIQFDNELLRGAGLGLNETLKNYDMLIESRKGAEVAKNVPGFKLDDHLEAMKLPRKNGEGMDAPRLWQEGKLGKLSDYVLNDVFTERSLFEYMYVHGKVANKYSPEFYDVEIPKWT